jgi:hypothetical protein
MKPSTSFANIRTAHERRAGQRPAAEGLGRPFRHTGCVGRRAPWAAEFDLLKAPHTPRPRPGRVAQLYCPASCFSAIIPSPGRPAAPHVSHHLPGMVLPSPAAAAPAAPGSPRDSRGRLVRAVGGRITSGDVEGLTILVAYQRAGQGMRSAGTRLPPVGRRYRCAATNLARRRVAQFRCLPRARNSPGWAPWTDFAGYRW